MDSGTDEDPQNLLFAAGDSLITKMFADGGSSSAAGDLFLDKSLVADGSLDTFMTSIAGVGSTLTLTLTANIPFEAAAFDNITITGIPEPSAVLLLGIGALAASHRRR
jgi:hypothetical protein